MTRRDWLIIGLLYVTVQGLQLGFWWWGFTASDAVPLDVQRPGQVLLLSMLASAVCAGFLYLLTQRTLRKGRNMRLPGFVTVVVLLGTTLALAVLARLGGPRFQPTVLLFPLLGCSLGRQLAVIQWNRSHPDAEPLF